MFTFIEFKLVRRLSKEYSVLEKILSEETNDPVEMRYFKATSFKISDDLLVQNFTTSHVSPFFFIYNNDVLLHHRHHYLHSHHLLQTTVHLNID